MLDLEHDAQWSADAPPHDGPDAPRWDLRTYIEWLAALGAFSPPPVTVQAYDEPFSLP